MPFSLGGKDKPKEKKRQEPELTPYDEVVKRQKMDEVFELVKEVRATLMKKSVSLHSFITNTRFVVARDSDEKVFIILDDGKMYVGYANYAIYFIDCDEDTNRFELTSEKSLFNDAIKNFEVFEQLSKVLHSKTIVSF